MLNRLQADGFAPGPRFDVCLMSSHKEPWLEGHMRSLRPTAVVFCLFSRGAAGRLTHKKKMNTAHVAAITAAATSCCSRGDWPDDIEALSCIRAPAGNGDLRGTSAATLLLSRAVYLVGERQQQHERQKGFTELHDAGWTEGSPKRRQASDDAWPEPTSRGGQARKTWCATSLRGTHVSSCTLSCHAVLRRLSCKIVPLGTEATARTTIQAEKSILMLKIPKMRSKIQHHSRFHQHVAYLVR